MTVPLFRQLFDRETSTYTYLIADRPTRTAAIVDPVWECAGRDRQLLHELDLTLLYSLETHIHADHVTGAAELQRLTGCAIGVPEGADVVGADFKVRDAEKLELGALEIIAIATPGHTSSHHAYLVGGDRVLTGDALLIRGCGRTDLQQGDASKLFDSVCDRLFVLPDNTLVYPGHDYQGHTVSTIGEEKRWNPRFGGRGRGSFIQLMGNLKPAPPKKLNEALRWNRYCGSQGAVEPLT